MAVDRNKVRTDVAFLRRRPHRPESVSNASESSTPTTGGISLSRPSTASPSSSGGLSLGSPATQQEPKPTTGKISFDRPGRTPSTSSIPVQNTAPTGGGLSLNRPSATETPSSGSGLSLKREQPAATASSPVDNERRGSSLSLKPKMDSELPKHSVPYFHNNMELSLDNPVVRLDFRQSGIGSLVVEGAEAFAWETQEKMGGLQVIVSENSSEVDPPMYGNRKLVEFYDDKLVLGLRHAANLRRLVVASQMDDLRVKLYDGSEIYMESDGGNNVLLITRIGHELECRMERINTIELNETFGIKFSHVSNVKIRQQ